MAMVGHTRSATGGGDRGGGNGSSSSGGGGGLRPSSLDPKSARLMSMEETRTKLKAKLDIQTQQARLAFSSLLPVSDLLALWDCIVLYWIVLDWIGLYCVSAKRDVGCAADDTVRDRGDAAADGLLSTLHWQGVRHLCAVHPLTRRRHCPYSCPLVRVCELLLFFSFDCLSFLSFLSLSD